MKRKTILLPEDLHRELTLTAALYDSNISKLVSQAVQYALMYKKEVYGFTKELEVIDVGRSDKV